MFVNTENVTCRRSTKFGHRGTGTLFGRRVEIRHDNSSISHAQMQPQLERRVQPGAQPKVQYSAKLPFHGTALQIREGIEGPRRQEQSKRAKVPRDLSTRSSLQLFDVHFFESPRPWTEPRLWDRVRQVDSWYTS